MRLLLYLVRSPVGQCAQQCWCSAPTRSNPFLLCLPLLLHTPPSLVCFSHPASVTPFGRTDLSLLEPLYLSLWRTTVPRPGQRLADHWCRCTKALTPGGDSSRCSTRQSSPAGSGESTLCGIQPELPPHLLSCLPHSLNGLSGNILLMNLFIQIPISGYPDLKQTGPFFMTRLCCYRGNFPNYWSDQSDLFWLCVCVCVTP